MQYLFSFCLTIYKIMFKVDYGLPENKILYFVFLHNSFIEVTQNSYDLFVFLDLRDNLVFHFQMNINMEAFLCHALCQKSVHVDIQRKAVTVVIITYATPILSGKPWFAESTAICNETNTIYICPFLNGKKNNFLQHLSMTVCSNYLF